MKILKECMPQLRYMGSLNKKALIKYIDTSHPRVIRCLYEIALNILFSHKNGLKISKKQLKPLKKHKKALLALVKTSELLKRKKILKKGGLVIGLLTVMATVITALAATF